MSEDEAPDDAKPSSTDVGDWRPCRFFLRAYRAPFDDGGGEVASSASFPLHRTRQGIPADFHAARHPQRCRRVCCPAAKSDPAGRPRAALCNCAKLRVCNGQERKCRPGNPEPAGQLPPSSLPACLQRKRVVIACLIDARTAGRSVCRVKPARSIFDRHEDQRAPYVRCANSHCCLRSEKGRFTVWAEGTGACSGSLHGCLHTLATTRGVRP